MDAWPAEGFPQIQGRYWFIDREIIDVCEGISAMHEYKASIPGLVHNAGDWSGAFEAVPAFRG